MIEAIGLTKDYGEKRAVDALSFTVQPGIVTGFLGPNGSGKSTTMRLILGLDRPTAGTVTVNGKLYRDYPAPLHEVGALLEARAVHTGRSAFNHLLALAQTHGVPRSRVEELIDRAGLRDVAQEAGRPVLARDGPAPRHRRRAPRRPGHPDPRRAGQRPRPRGDPVDPEHAEGARRGGTDGLRLLAPDERDGADGRPPDRDRARQADRRPRASRSSCAAPPRTSSAFARRRRPSCATRSPGPT